MSFEFDGVREIGRQLLRLFDEEAITSTFPINPNPDDLYENWQNIRNAFLAAPLLVIARVVRWFGWR